MNGNIAPVAFTPLSNGFQYIGLFVPLDGRYLIARKSVMGESARFDYAAYQDKASFEAAWLSRDGQSYFSEIMVEANLAVLVNQFGGQAAMVKIANFPAQQHVLIDNPAQAAAGLTDAQLRAAPVPVSVGFPTTQPVSGPATNAELRAAPLPVSVNFPASQPISGTVTVANPTGATDVSALAKEATLAAANTLLAGIKAKTDNLDVLLSTRTKPADVQKVDGSGVTQPVSVASLPLPAGAATEATLSLIKSALAAPALPTGASTLAAQQLMQVALDAVKVSTAAGSTAALQAELNGKVALAAKQDAGNASLATLATNSPALVSGRVPVDIGSTVINSSPAPRTSGGLTGRVVITNAGTTLTPSATPTVVKATPGQIYSIDAFNESSSKRYLNVYNKATAPGATDVPVAVFVLFPGVALPHIDYGSLGSAYSAGIALTITANNGLVGQLTSVLTGLAVANEVTLNIQYA